MNNSPTSPPVELVVEAPDAVERNREPVTCGIPWPRGGLRDATALRLNQDGRTIPLQTRVLDRWADGSVRWVLLDWQADVRGSARYRLEPMGGESPADAPSVRVTRQQGGVRIDTGSAVFTLAPGEGFPLRSVSAGGREVLDASLSGFMAEDGQGLAHRLIVDRMDVDEPGPLRASVSLAGRLASGAGEPLAEVRAWLHFFAGSAAVRWQVTIRNPRRAEHPGGMWDLGDAGSVYFKDVSLSLVVAGDGREAVVRYSPELGSPVQEGRPTVELYQDSSGGENWQSTNHLNRERVVPHAFRGYRLRSADRESAGRRATPAVQLEREGRTLGFAMEYFWQNFPKAVEATEGTLTVRLFPRQSAAPHELQGGEQKTHSFYLAFAPDAVTASQPLHWCRSPAVARATPRWYADSSAVPYLTPRSDDPHADYVALVDAAIEGDDTFEHKREVIDEYGWRHFGEIYGDHEAVFHTGPTPLVSHYNNQYDPVAGFAYQYLRSGDARWLRQMNELAAHVADIDLYHTDHDKAAYNHGLFWHTYHYVDADTATHRTYPRRGRVPPSGRPVPGGGPANEQNYAHGFVLHYFLTGDPLSLEEGIARARWVVDMDDGRKTVFRWLAGGSTGLASKSRTEDYHGPGRGAANSISALVDGHRLSGDRAFLDKAEELIRRSVHPADDVAGMVAFRDDRTTVDAENRWFYTMFLQSLGKYLDHKADLGELDARYAYARESLLHYARWMAEFEYPYLDRPKVLEYPTETWAAQDMRKCEVFQFAALHAEGPERVRFRERAEFFYRSSVDSLSGMKTRTLCRPVVLLLSFGFSRNWHRLHPDAAAAAPHEAPRDFGRPKRFIPQKTRAIRRFKQLVVAGGLLGVLALTLLLFRLLT